MPRTALTLPLVLILLAAQALAGTGPTIFINEFHYDNTGTDAGEFVEIAGPAGQNLTGYSIVLYNGANGQTYDTDALSGVIPNQQNGFGTASISYPSNGIQNGSPDGIALVGPAGVIQFLCYEGTFTASNGPAQGMTCTDIGVSEGGTEPVGQSLQLRGTGTTYDDFTWSGPVAHTQNLVNVGQMFGGGTNPEIEPLVPVPSSVSPGDSTLLRARITPGQNPASTGLQVRVNLTSIGGAASQAMVDDGTAGDVTANDGIYSVLATVAAGTTAGSKNLPVTASDAQGRSATPQNITLQVIVLTPTNPSATGSASPSSVAPGEATLLTVSVTPGTNPTSTGITVTADLSAIGGSATQPLFDDGTNGDTVANNNVFSYQATVAASTTAGDKSLPFTVRDAQNRTAAPASISLTVRQRQFVVISQVYGGGGNSGATLRNDFIEIFNRGTTSVDLSGWSVQYASSTGSSWSATALSGVIPPGGYYLVQQAAGSGGTQNLPTPDAVGTIAMAAGSGKVALVERTAALTGSCPTAVVDFVGYGSANCFEGTAPAPALSNTTAAQRKRSGCNDSNDNANDFQARPPLPRNSASPVKDCQAPDLVLTIPQIQGSGLQTPFPDREVETTGVVTARKSNGFFIQNPTPDADPTTSEGLFVFVGSLPAVQTGDSVHVRGVAGEFFNLTQISAFAADVTVLSSGNPVPAPLTLDSTILNPAGTLTQLEPYEGMRVQAASLTSVTPTNGFGEIFTVLTGTPRTFREEGLEISQSLPPNAPCCVPRFDENPEKLMVDTDGLLGSAPVTMTSNVVLSGVSGPLDFTFGEYKVLPESAPIVSANMSAAALPQPAADEFTVGSFNLLNLFTSNPNFNDRLQKASLAIRTILRSPDIIGVEEVGDLAALTALANRINADSAAAGQGNPMYEAHLLEGTDEFPGDDIDVGFLVKRSRVEPVELLQRGKGLTFTDPTEGDQDTLFERPPLVLRARIQSPHGSKFPVTVIVNHMQSLIDVNDPARGPRQRLKRQLQAEFTARLAEEFQDGNLILVGDFNAFQFNDGLVDVMGTIAGTPTDSDRVVLASPDLVDPDLTILVNTLPAGERYSFIFGANAQALDHVVVDGDMRGRLSRFAYARNNADFPTSFSADVNRPERISDHDMPVAYFLFPPPVADLSVAKNASASSVVTGSDFSYSIAVTNSGPDHARNVTLTDELSPATTFRALVAPAGWNCTAPPAGSTGSITCSTPTLEAGASASFTVTVTAVCSTADGATVSNVASVQSETPDADSSNNSATATITASNPPPVITGASVDKTTIKPPNHKMVDVRVSYSVSDNCGPVRTSLSVSSNEPVNGTGDGNTEVDWEVVNANLVRLRAERAGTGNGRVYTIVITAEDSAGNVSRQSLTVTVPK